MPRPIHFEIQADQPERAITFYRAMFGWEFTSWPGPVQYWIIKTGEETPGIDGGLLPRRGTVTPDCAVIGYVCTIGVAKLDASVTKALGIGGAMAVPKMPIPGVGWLAYVKDTEGNIFGMMEADAKAA